MQPCQTETFISPCEVRLPQRNFEPSALSQLFLLHKSVGLFFTVNNLLVGNHTEVLALSDTLSQPVNWRLVFP